MVVAFSPGDFVLAVDSSTLAHLDSAAALIEYLPSVDAGYTAGPSYIGGAFNSSGQLLLANGQGLNAGTNSVVKYSQPPTVNTPWLSTDAGLINNLWQGDGPPYYPLSPYGIAMDPDDSLWVGSIGCTTPFDRWLAHIGTDGSLLAWYDLTQTGTVGMTGINPSGIWPALGLDGHTLYYSDGYSQDIYTWDTITHSQGANLVTAGAATPGVMQVGSDGNIVAGSSPWIVYDTGGSTLYTINDADFMPGGYHSSQAGWAIDPFDPTYLYIFAGNGSLGAGDNRIYHVPIATPASATSNDTTIGIDSLSAMIGVYAGPPPVVTGERVWISRLL